MTESLSMDQAFIRKLTDIVTDNISNEHFGVKDLAREAGVSRITLYRKIKSIKNQDTGQYIREIRLRRAMELLRQNAGTVSEIAYMVGFGNPYYFNRCFHQFFGFPPGKVKKEAVHHAEETIFDRFVFLFYKTPDFPNDIVDHHLCHYFHLRDLLLPQLLYYGL